MIKVLALFPCSMEDDARDQLASKMIQAMQQADGLRSLNIMSPGGPPPYSKVLDSSFDSLEAFMAWVQTPAAQADKEDMISSGVIRIHGYGSTDVLTFENAPRPVPGEIVTIQQKRSF
jgi:heme-degrading monooxygenase HmoA